jgi:alkylmercury lyase
MSPSTGDTLARSIANNSLSRERAVFFLSLIQLLADGAPVTVEQLATAVHRSPDEVTEALHQFPEIVFDEAGRVVGAGLSLLPTPHRFEVNGRELFTWCALDTLIFPALLGRTANIASTCPVTGAAIHLTVTPEHIERASPSDAVVSVVVPAAGEASCNVRESFCIYSHFLRSREAAAPWLLEHPGAILLSVEDAFQLGREVAGLMRAVEP